MRIMIQGGWERLRRTIVFIILLIHLFLNESINKLFIINIACIIMLLHYIIILLIYFHFAHISCEKWCAGEAELKEFLQAECTLRITRWVCYLTALVFSVLLVFPRFHNQLWDVDAFTYCAVLMGGLLLFSLTQSLFRVTFRRLPNWCIAIGITLMYEIWIMANQKCPDWLNPAAESILNWTSNNQKIVIGALSGSAIVTSLIVAIKELVSGVWQANRPGAEDRETWRASLRKTRLRVLQHRWYKEHNIFSSFNRSILAIMAVVALPVVAATALGLACRAADNGEGFRLMDGGGQLLVWLLVFGVTLLLLGVITHFTSRDASLLQAEFYYICHTIPWLTADEVNGKKPHWLDACQVFAHVYNSKIDVFSEDKTLHDLKNVIKKTADHLSNGKNDKRVCEVYFYTELLQSYVETKFKDERHSGRRDGQASDDGKREDYTEYPLAVHLARTVSAAFSERAKNIKSLQPSSGFFDLLAYAKRFYFKPTGEPTVWERCQAMTSLNTEEFQNLVILDIWCDLLQSQPAAGGCAMAPMCNEQNGCPVNCGPENTKSANPRKAAAAAFLLLFPLLVGRALKKLYGSKLEEKDIGRLADDAVSYYRADTSGTSPTPGRGCKDFLRQDDIEMRSLIEEILRYSLVFELSDELPQYLYVLYMNLKLKDKFGKNTTNKIKRSQNWGTEYSELRVIFRQYIRNESSDSFDHLLYLIELMFEQNT